MKIVKQQQAELEIALQSQRACDMMPQDLSRVILNLIAGIHTYSGRVISDEDQVVQARFLTEDIRKDFRWIHELEIKIALNAGVRGEYGEFYGLNNKTYISWLNAFRSSEKRIKAVNESSGSWKGLPQKTEPTDQEKEEIFQTAIAACINVFKRTGVVFDNGGGIYDGLDKRGLINLTVEQKGEYMKTAERIEYNRLVEERKTALLHGRRMDSNKMDKAIQELMNEEKKEVVIAEAKRLALKDWIINEINKTT